MVEHFYIIYHGQEVRPLKAFLICPVPVCDKSVQKDNHCRWLWRCHSLQMSRPLHGTQCHLNRWDFSLELKKNEFLGDKVNNQRFLNMFSVSLEKKGYTIIHIRGNGDTLSQTARLHRQRMSTLSLLEMTQIFLILLSYHGDALAKDLFLKPKMKSNTEEKHKGWNILEDDGSIGQRNLFQTSLCISAT